MVRKPLPEEERCQHEVQDKGGFHFYTCSYRHIMKHEGKRFCNRHDPVKRKAKQDAEEAKWREESASNEREVLRKQAVHAIGLYYLVRLEANKEPMTNGLKAWFKVLS